jgi:nitrate reductase alpha subunit
LGAHDEIVPVGFPYFGGQTHETWYFQPNANQDVLDRNIPVRILDLNGKKWPLPASLICCAPIRH